MEQPFDARDVGSESRINHLADEFRRSPIRRPLLQMKSVNAEPVRPKALVVDDEKLIANTTSEILEGAGFDVRAAYDGWTALEIAEKFRPEYLLTDVLMPGMNGVELAIAISNKLPGARIVLFSGQAGISEILLKAYDLGYEFELVAKPLHPDKLIARLINK